MTKADVGAALAAILSVLASVAVMARDYAGKAFEYIRVSFVALVSSKAAWAAVIVTFLGAYAFGYISGAAGKRALRSEVVRLETRAKVSAAAAATATARAAKSDEAAKDAARAVEALKAEVAALKGARPAASASVAPVVKRPAAKVPLKKPAAGEPSKPRWTPWG